MLSKSLLKKTIKDNYKLWAVITGALMVFLLICLGVMYSMSNTDFGNGASGADMTSGILDQYYGMFALLLTMIYIILTANKLLAAQVDKGSLSYVMANPVKRNQVSITQALYLVGSVIAMFILITITGLIMIAATGVNVEIGSFILLNVGSMLLLLAISGISYLASCIFNLSSKSLAVGAGIPIAFFLFGTLASFSSMGVDALKYFKYFTINTLFSISDILAYSTNMIWQFLILFGIAAACYVGGVLYFKKKDLPL